MAHYSAVNRGFLRNLIGEPLPVSQLFPEFRENLERQNPKSETQKSLKALKSETDKPKRSSPDKKRSLKRSKQSSSEIDCNKRNKPKKKKKKNFKHGDVFDDLSSSDLDFD